MQDRTPLPMRLALSRLLRRALNRFRAKSKLAIPDKPPKPPNSKLDWIWTGKYWASPWVPRTSDHFLVSSEIIQVKVMAKTVNLFVLKEKELGDKAG